MHNASNKSLVKGQSSLSITRFYVYELMTLEYSSIISKTTEENNNNNNNRVNNNLLIVDSFQPNASLEEHFGLRDHNWVYLTYRPKGTVTLNSNFAILKTLNLFRVKEDFSL